MNCRHCRASLELKLIDLGSAPPSNAYLTEEDLHRPEKWYPLRVLVCERCWLVQTEDFAHAGELFSDDYAYFSGFSASWLDHSRRYVEQVADRFGLDGESHVVEVAANDGYLLQYVKAAGIPCTGVEPTASTASAARAKGIEIIGEFFGSALGTSMVAEGRAADLVVANNVLAHVPDINDFVAGFAALLKSTGVTTVEFPHLLRLLAEVQFDTIYHEHFSYLSLCALRRIFEANGLAIFDVEELPTHGGSLRVYAQRSDTGEQPVSPRVDALLAREAKAGLETAAAYVGFQEQSERVKCDLLAFLIEAKRTGRAVVAYGAAAKGNTLLNFGGVRPDLLGIVCDANPFKQGKYLPGSRIPITSEQAIRERRPSHVLILPWNLAPEIRSQLGYIDEWGGQFVTAVPKLRVLEKNDSGPAAELRAGARS